MRLPDMQKLLRAVLLHKAAYSKISFPAFVQYPLKIWSILPIYCSLDAGSVRPVVGLDDVNYGSRERRLILLRGARESL